MSENVSIENVSDTSLWVAYYRAKESERKDALFRDPLAKVLVGERGKKLAENMKALSPYVESSVVMRTVIIDEFIHKLIVEGVDGIINLGAGLDTRPYRMNLPAGLQWVEVDYPNIINHKNMLLRTETPKCQLVRVALDLADDVKRREFLSQALSQTKKVLVLTEGVIPYLSPEQVTELAKDLYAQTRFAYWITEYFNPEAYKYLKSSLRTKKMKNAPFRFFPEDWFGFFESKGWVAKEIRYNGEESVKHGRRIPMPWWGRIFMLFISKERSQQVQQMTGYVLFQKKKA